MGDGTNLLECGQGQGVAARRRLPSPCPRYCSRGVYTGRKSFKGAPLTIACFPGEPPPDAWPKPSARTPRAPLMGDALPLPFERPSRRARAHTGAGDGPMAFVPTAYMSMYAPKIRTARHERRSGGGHHPVPADHHPVPGALGSELAPAADGEPRGIPRGDDQERMRRARLRARQVQGEGEGATSSGGAAEDPQQPPRVPRRRYVVG